MHTCFKTLIICRCENNFNINDVKKTLAALSKNPVKHQKIFLKTYLFYMV